MNSKITFPRLASMLADESGRSKRFSEDFLREFFALISEQLVAGESVKIKGLGTFRVSRVEPRKSVDVTTGLPMEIAGHSKVVFIPAKEMADAVNAPFEAFSAVEIGDDVDPDSLNLDKVPEPQNEPEVTETVFEAIQEEEIPETVAPIEEEEIRFEEEVSGGEPAIEEPKSEVEISADAGEEPTPEEELIEDEIIEEEPTKEEPIIEKDPEFEPVAEPIETVDEQEEEPETESEPEADGNPEEVPETEPEPEEYEESTRSACAIGSARNFDEVEDRKFNDRRHWTKGFIMGMLACLLLIAVAGGIAALIICPDKINTAIKDMVASNNEVTEQEIEMNNMPQPEASAKQALPDESKMAGAEENAATATAESDEKAAFNTENEVPTAPSDAVVYDTIGKTRYLTTMAKAHYGNYNLWPIIYEENKAKLGHPDRIRPGTPVVIPKLNKYGIDPFNKKDVEKIKNLGIEIYARYGKKI